MSFVTKMRAIGFVIAVTFVLSSFSACSESVKDGKDDDFFDLKDEIISHETGILRDTLASYYAEHGRYPGDLNILVEQYGLEKDVAKHFGYGHDLCYGSYRISFKGKPKGVGVGSYRTIYSEMSDTAKLILLVRELKNYHVFNERFPEDLLEYAHKEGLIFEDEIRGGKFIYSVSNDLQSFTLNGMTFWPVQGHPDEEKVAKINQLQDALDLYRLDTGRYPEDFQKLLESDLPFNFPLYDIGQFLEDEKIIYSSSDDGMIAYLNGVDIECLDDRIFNILGGLFNLRVKKSPDP
jgi:hypothetical protein